MCGVTCRALVKVVKRQWGSRRDTSVKWVSCIETKMVNLA